MCIYCTTSNYRKIYENHIGPIPKEADGRTYEIHHVDGNHSNNEPSNLVAVTLQEHYDIHYKQGDYSACKLMKLQRMDYTPEELRELGSKATIGTTTVVDKLGNKMRVPVDDPRILSGELVGHTKGKTTVKDKNGNIFSVDKTDPRLKTGELVGITKGLVMTRDIHGITVQVSVDDPRISTGELTYINHGYIPVWVGKKQKCPYCLENFDSGNFTQFHGEKCLAKTGLLTNKQKIKNRKKKEKVISVDGVIYKTLTEASKKLGINIGTLSVRARNSKNTSVFYV